MTPPPTPRAPATAGRSAWWWVPSLYFAQGLPYVLAMTVSVVMLKNLGLGNAEVALHTSGLYLPWVVKPLWSPLVDLVGTKRRWVVACQLAIGAALAALAATLSLPAPLWLTLALLWAVALASATHDIAADGSYLLALPPDAQAAFVGVRSTAYRLATIAGQGGLVVLAGWLLARGAPAPRAWALVFGAAAAIYVALALWHAAVLPRPPRDRPTGGAAPLGREAASVFAEFFRRPDIVRVLAFLLLYRLAEAQALKLVTPFMLDAPSAGGLGLSTQDVGIAYGTVGVAALTAGGLLGGWLVAQRGLRPLLWPLLLAMHVPNLVFVALAAVQPSALWVVGAAIAVEQFGYGLGFTAYLVAMLMIAGQGRHPTAHYALCTGFMALGMMLPGMVAGWLQAELGYLRFFVWVCVATLPSFAAAALLRIEPGYGRRADGA